MLRRLTWQSAGSFCSGRWKEQKCWRWQSFHLLHTSDRHPGSLTSDLTSRKHDICDTVQRKCPNPNPALTHLGPASSSAPAQRVETASAEPPGCAAGRRRAAGGPRATAVWRGRPQSGARPATSSSWLPRSRSCWRRWTRRPAGASQRCRRSAGTDGEERTAPPPCTPPWCRRRSNLGGDGSVKRSVHSVIYNQNVKY